MVDIKSNTAKIIAGIIVLASWIIYASLLSAEKPSGFILFIAILCSGGFVILIFSDRLKALLVTKEAQREIPDALDSKQLDKEVKTNIGHYLWTQPLMGNVVQTRTHNIGENQVYLMKIKLRNKRWMQSGVNDSLICADEVFMIINGTYPKKVRPSILPPDTPNENLSHYVNMASLNPLDSPDVQTITTSMDSFNRPVEQKIITSHKKNDKQEENKVEEVL